MDLARNPSAGSANTKDKESLPLKLIYNKIEKQYKYIGYLSLPLLLLVIAGFYKSYYGLFPDFNSSITVPMHFHAFVMSLYVILLIVQPFLIFYKKFETHRLLGKFSYVFSARDNFFLFNNDP